MRKLFILKNQKGQATLTLVLALMAALTILVSALAVLTVNELRKVNNIVKSSQSYYAAEGGAEDALIRIKNKKQYTTNYTVSVGSGTAEVTLSGPLEDLFIISKGDVSNRIRKIAVHLTSLPSDTEVNFNYGVQVGDGGLLMKTNSQVNGNVYANGKISGPTGVGAGNMPIVKGDVYSAAPAGNDGINNIKINKSAPGSVDANGHANTIKNVISQGTLYCQTGSGNTPSSCNTTQADPTPQPLPISDSQITIWKDWADDGGTLGNQTIQGGQTSQLGPVKIDGNLTIRSNSVLIITGTIWVTGNVNIESNSLILLHSSFGANGSSLILADGKVIINSNITICGSNGGVQGSCNAENGSYIMLISTDPSTDEANPAMVAFSNILTSVLYTHNGAVLLNSNVHVKEVTGYSLILESESTVTYETGLASVLFTSGPGARFNINSWQEIP